MAVDLHTASAASPLARAVPLRTVGALTGHALRAFTRTPVAVFFTLGFPLAFLVIVSSVVGNATTGAGVPLAQFLVPPFAVFGVTEAVFCVLAVDTAQLRENGVLRRLRGTPVPAWTVLVSRIASAVAVATAAVVVLTVVGVGFYRVEIIWRKTPALLLTLLVGIACFTALGLALVATTRTVLAAQTLSQGLLIPLAFISDMFIINADLPGWLSAIGDALPLRHFARAMAETFDPTGGYGFSPGHLAVIAVWGGAAALVGGWRFGWNPRGGSTTTPRSAPVVPDIDRHAPVTRLSPPVATGRPSAPALLAGELAYAFSVQRRDLLSVFFAVVFPVLLLVLMPAAFGDAEMRGVSLPQYMLPGMMAYAVAVSGYVNLAEGIAQARERGVLKRLRGTPLPAIWYLAGRVGVVLALSTLTALLLVVVAVGSLHVRVAPARLPAVALAVLLGVLCFSALGLAVAGLVRSAQALTAVTLGTLLPLSFISDVFLVGDARMPEWLVLLGDLLPLKHLARALLTATRPGAGGGFAWPHLAVLGAWTVAAVLAVEWSRRRPRTDRRRLHPPVR